MKFIRHSNRVRCETLTDNLAPPFPSFPQEKYDTVEADSTTESPARLINSFISNNNEISPVINHLMKPWGARANLRVDLPWISCFKNKIPGQGSARTCRCGWGNTFSDISLFKAREQGKHACGCRGTKTFFPTFRGLHFDFVSEGFYCGLAVPNDTHCPTKLVYSTPVWTSKSAAFATIW